MSRPVSLCRHPSCAGRRDPKVPMCPKHWARVPEDLKTRYEWAKDESPAGISAALLACIDAV